MSEFKTIKVRHGEEVWAAVADVTSETIVFGPFEHFYIAHNLSKALNAALEIKKNLDLARLPVA